MAFDSIKDMYDTMPKQDGQFGRYPTLKLLDGDIAVVHFLASGNEGDHLSDSARFHQIEKISQRTNKAYTQELFCKRSYEEDTECEACSGVHGANAMKTKMQIGIWMYCYAIFHNENKQDMSWVKETFEKRTMFKEVVNVPIIWKRGPGNNGSFIEQIMSIRDLQDTLNISDFLISRKGSTMNDTHYSVKTVSDAKRKEMTEEQKDYVIKLPSIKELFSGKKKWPDDGTSNDEDEMASPADLAALLEGKKTKVFQ